MTVYGYILIAISFASFGFVLGILYESRLLLRTANQIVPRIIYGGKQYWVFEDNDEGIDRFFAYMDHVDIVMSYQRSINHAGLKETNMMWPIVVKDGIHYYMVAVDNDTVRLFVSTFDRRKGDVA